jgi:hypothetical protein
MKLLLIALFSALSAPSFAATLTASRSVSDADLKSFISSLSDLSDAWEGDTALVITKYNYSNRSSREAWTNTVKQAIYKARGSDAYSRPDSVDVTSQRKTTRNYKSAVLSAMAHADSDTIDDNKDDLTDALDLALTDKSHMKLFIVSDGNSFGYCESLAVVDQNAEQIIIASSCYSE